MQCASVQCSTGAVSIMKTDCIFSCFAHFELISLISLLITFPCSLQYTEVAVVTKPYEFKFYDGNCTTWNSFGAREQKWNAEGCRLKLIFSIVRSAAAGTAPAFFK